MTIKLEDFASELVAGNNFVKAGFGGFAGAGKSKTSSEFVIGAYKDFGYTKPVLIIDNEKGSRFLIPQFRAAGVKALLKETTNIADILTAFELLRAGEIQFIFIDSLTKVYYRYVRDYMEKNKRQFMELMDWGKILPKWQETFSDAFVAAQGSIVFTGRGGYSYEKEEDTKDENGRVVRKGQFVKSGVKMKLAGETPFEPDLNIWMEQEQEVGPNGLTVWREAQVMKDRSGLIDGKTFKNPTYAHFAPFVRYLIDAPSGVVQGETSGANLAPGENWDSYDRQRKRDIVLEEVFAELEKMFTGQTAEMKAARGECFESVFKTRSKTAVENMALEVLIKARNEIWIKSRGHAYGASALVSVDAANETPKTDVAA